MFFRAGAHLPVSGLLRQARHLFLDRRGIAAVEFAFIAPLLLSMYFVTMEVSQGIEANKKVGRIGSMVADLVTQQSSVKLEDVKAIMDIGQSILQPYSRSKPTIIITAINVSYSPSPVATVAWSVKMENGIYTRPFTPGSPASIPDDLMFDQGTIERTFLIRVESDLAYKPVITWSASGKPALGLAAAFDGISMSETYYMRPRMSKEISCSNC